MTYLLFYDKSKKITNTESVIINNKNKIGNNSFDYLKSNEQNNNVKNDIIRNNSDDEEDNNISK